PESGAFLGTGKNCVTRLVKLAKLQQGVRRAIGAQREDLVAAGMARNHVERARAHRAGCAENREVHAAALTHGQSSAATGKAAVALSMRSRIPPWPGRSVPLSLTAACRLAADSNRSPTMLRTASRAAARRYGTQRSPSMNVPRMIA